MPQMAPLNWLILAIVFSLVFLIFNIMNYFSFNYEIKSSKTKMKKALLNWKW